MFDPYGIYTRSQRKTHTGQIIRKKPIALKGSVSTKDYDTIKDYAEALGYQLIPKAMNPFPEEELRLSNDAYAVYKLPSDFIQGYFNLLSLIPFIQNLPCMLIEPSLAYTLNSLEIGFFLEFESMTASTGIYNQMASFRSYHFNQPVNVTFVDSYSRAIIVRGFGDGFQWLFRSDQQHLYEQHNEIYNRPVPEIVGPVDYIPARWEDNEALDVYKAIQSYDPQSLPPIGLPTINYFEIYKSSSTVDITVRFHVTVVTTWTHTANTEWIAQ